MLIGLLIGVLIALVLTNLLGLVILGNGVLQFFSKPLTIQIQHSSTLENNVEEPAVLIPEEISTYLEQESDNWAINSRKRRAVMLYLELKDWDAVFNTLKREDSIN